MKPTDAKIPISKNMNENIHYFQMKIGVNVSFDLGVRNFQHFGVNYSVYYVNGLVDSQLLFDLLFSIQNAPFNQDEVPKDIFSSILSHLNGQQVTVIDALNDASGKLLSGIVILLVEGETRGIALDVRSYPGRSPAEPDTEKVVRGSRDGYTENIIVNTALTRRRIRDENLRIEIMQVGERSKTDVAIGYIKDIANPELVDTVRKRLEEISTDGLTMSDKTVEEYLVRQGMNPYPLVRFTERPDVASVHLLEGHVIIIVDTSPSVIIAPTTFWHHTQHAEEYRQVPLLGTFMRMYRFIGIFASIFILPMWLLFSYDLSLLPHSLAFIGPKETTNVPVFWQIFFADVGIEFLRMAAIHTPTPLSTAMGLVAGAVLGQFAVDVGLLVPEVILYVSLAAVGAFATPSYELGTANKFVKTFLLFFAAIFGVEGFVISVTVFILMLAQTRSFATPYFWPFMPFSWGGLKNIFIRFPVTQSNVRTSVAHPVDIKKE